MVMLCVEKRGEERGVGQFVWGLKKSTRIFFPAPAARAPERPVAIFLTRARDLPKDREERGMELQGEGAKEALVY